MAVSRRTLLQLAMAPAVLAQTRASRAGPRSDRRRRVYPGTVRDAGLRAGRAGEHHSRRLACGLSRRRRRDSHGARTRNDLAGRR